MNRTLVLLLLLVTCWAWGASKQDATGAPAPSESVASAPSIKLQNADKNGNVAQVPDIGVLSASDADNGAPDYEFWVKGRAVADQRQHDVSLGDYVILKLNDKFSTYLKTDRVGHKLGLYINELYFSDLPAVPVIGRENAVMFHLARTDSNRDSWSVLFARKSFSLKKNVSCASNPSNIIRLAVGYEDGMQVGPNVDACLNYFPNAWSAGLMLAGAAVLIAMTLFLSFTTSMLRDPGFPVGGKKATWSLARFQMALWFVTVVCGVLFTYAVTGDIAPIPDGVLILMGIGAGTAVGSFAINAVNISFSKTEYEAVKRQESKLETAAAIASTNANNARNANPVDPKLADLDQVAANAQSMADEITAKRKSFETSASRHFFYDILSDGNGIAFHRLQVFAWTMTYWFMFIGALWHKITLIDFGVTQLALMGISGATYLGFKLSEAPKQPGAGQGSKNP